MKCNFCYFKKVFSANYVHLLYDMKYVYILFSVNCFNFEETVILLVPNN